MIRCPNDREILASNDVHGYRYYSCETCGGNWIPGRWLHQALSARGIEELRLLPNASPSAFHCLDCHVACEAMKIEGCTLDVCGACHGVWLDFGEVQQVKMLFPKGSAMVDADADRVAKETNRSSE